mmetsp:Transcript_22476/g.25293  ORF Transcript_22476/g.25293 Transcript_22476/m.25293 type:complete len:114 (+) Transcript_22476:166-507(+)
MNEKETTTTTTATTTTNPKIQDKTTIPYKRANRVIFILTQNDRRYIPLSISHTKSNGIKSEGIVIVCTTQKGSIQYCAYTIDRQLQDKTRQDIHSNRIPFIYLEISMKYDYYV